MTDAGSSQLGDIVKAFAKLFTSLGSIFVEWAWSEMVVRAGWLPHASIPPELIADAEDLAEADRRLTSFFRDHWPEIEQSLRASVRATDADADAKDAFNESLKAHGLGLYRVPPPLLFPHIERVARDALLPKAMGASATEKLFEAIGELGPSEFTMPGVSGVRLYSKLAEHLYKQVRTPSEVEEARLDPVPNRHAVLHGRVNYASEKSSLNMLIMTDFIFDAISKIARERSTKSLR